MEMEEVLCRVREQYELGFRLGVVVILFAEVAVSLAIFIILSLVRVWS